MLEMFIKQCINAKTGNKEFALFFNSPGWWAEIGNGSRYVMLGEVEGEFASKGDSALEAVTNLLELLKEKQ